MGQRTFESSDSIRSAAPLKHVQYVDFEEPLKLALGGRLPRVRVAYETYGRLNEARDNAVLICHALSGDSHVASHDESDDPGWWEIAVGPGKFIDTNKYFVICPNILGGCRGTTGPNCLNPATGRPYGPEFPPITVGDIVNVQCRLIDHLGIPQLLAVTGGSMGGMLVLQWAVSHPDRVRAAIPIATAPLLTSQGLAFDVIGRNAIQSDPDFRGGYYYDESGPGPQGLFQSAAPVSGLAIARMIGHITYLSPEAMRIKFGANRNAPPEVESDFEKDTSVASYLAYQGDKFVERFDANSYIVISRAMDSFNLGEGAARGPNPDVSGGAPKADTPALGTPLETSLQASLSRARCRWLVVSFVSDWLFTPAQSREIVRALVRCNQPVSYCNVASHCGHDAFLLEDELDFYGGLVAGFLAQVSNPDVRRGSPGEEPEADAQGQINHPDMNIYHGRRIDYDLIEQLLVEDSGASSPSVLDLGCGGGQLMLRLKRRGLKRLQGVENNQSAVLGCVQRGVDVIHADLNDGLEAFTGDHFDCVLLSQTLQTVFNVERLIADMLRVGRRCIVTFPNFAYRSLREMLVEQGRAPRATGLLRHTWYNTPNIRFLSIADFQDYCAEKGVKIHRLVALNTESRRQVPLDQDPNRNADLAIFVISRK